ADGRGGVGGGLEVRALIARVASPVVALRIFLGALHHAGQEPAAERRERHESNAELAHQRDDSRLEVALPQRVLALERRDRVHRVRAAYRLLPGLGQAEMPHLALADESR